MNARIRKMSFLNDFCCICMNKSDLKHIFDMDNNGLSHYNKLTTSIVEMDFKEMNDQRLICGECCVTLNTVYNFRQTCLRGKTNLITYISQLQTSSHVIDTIEIKKEIEIKCENEGDGFEGVSNSHCLLKIKNDPDEIGASICCICMNKSDLKHLFDVDYDGVSRYNKLTSSIAEMYFKEMNNERLICGECCVTLNTVYNFRQTCLRSKTNLITYLSQLQTSSDVTGTTSNPLNIKPELVVVKEERESEDSYSFDENIPQGGFKTESYEENIHFLASVKEECESKEDSSTREDTADHMNEDAQSDAKVDVEQTKMEDENYSEFCLIGHQIDLKEEKPQDGSSSQADAGISGEPTEKKETKSATKVKRNRKKKPGRSLKCEVCGKCFKHMGNFNYHMQIHTGERPFVCDICQKSFTRKYLLADHMNVHSGERPYKCGMCEKSFTQKDTLSVHIKLHSDERPFECPICKKGFKLKNKLTAHEKIHSDDRPYECEICQKNFPSKWQLTLHLRIHSGIKPYECEICKKSYYLKCKLAEHSQVHSDERPFECQKCHKTFKRKNVLNGHIQNMHSNEGKYECKIRKKECVDKDDLAKHLLEGHGDRTFICEICNKTFAAKKSLLQHLRTHSGKKSYECEICKMCFINIDNLTIHKLSHSKDEQYKCEVCAKDFSNQNDLAQHLLVHPDDRPYHCEVCKKNFTVKRYLDVHMRTHSGERPHQCKICNKSFIQKSALNSHKKIHSSERAFECEICKAGFNHKCSLIKHMTIHSEEILRMNQLVCNM